MILWLTMLVDLDHLLATPIFSQGRCSVGFHALHSYAAILIYLVALFLRQPYRWIAIGLLFHMFTDFIDCLFMYAKCATCMAESPAFSLLKWVSEIV
ncbi:MAG: hypothetical protein ACI8RL_000635 [Cyclobacteriaceae bacterium]|jgi:hypothetical protein